MVVIYVVFVVDYWIRAREREKRRGVKCPGVSGAIIIQPSGSLSGFILIFNKQVWALYISLSAKELFRLQRLLFDFANWFINLFSDWFPDSFPDSLIDSSTSCLELNCMMMCLPRLEGCFKRYSGCFKVTFMHSGGQSIFQHAAHRSIKYWWRWSAENWKETLWFIMLLDLPGEIVFMIHILLHISCCHCVGQALWKLELQRRMLPSAGKRLNDTDISQCLYWRQRMY